MKVEYEGLHSGLPWIQRTAVDLGLPAEDLCDGVAIVLDYLRRKRALWDPVHETFSRFWMDGDLEIQQGYLPELGAPNATKLRREPQENKGMVVQWLSERSDTTLKQMARKWGVKNDGLADFLERLFTFLVDQRLLRAVTLKGSKGKPHPGASGVYQVDADRLRLQPNRDVWRCASCRRRIIRRAPHNACPAWRCNGTLEFVREDPDNYDLQLLDQGYSMLRPEEHTAMVPHDERERLENLFKGDSEAINTFVCTQTLELGVDIGQLDAVLMRNVPPLPANYWQRAGRAGRRHRMAVNITYCRPVSHDRAYFNDPLKLLTGRVDPPAFNLCNEVMVAKHVWATAITRLHQYTRDPARPGAEREAVDVILRTCLPDRVSSYLFEGGLVRTRPFDLAPLQQLIEANLDDLCRYVESAFVQGWPEQDARVVAPATLRHHLTTMVEELKKVLERLNRRLRWARDQINRLNAVRDREGTLQPEDDALFKRCDALVKRLKGATQRGRREAEGYDDVNTFGVLAAEGFLPGYGLEVGSVLGTAEIPFWRTGAMAFALPRPASVALREYVPGNLIYANGNRFVARRFHRDADEQTAETPVYEVNIDRQAVNQTRLAAATASLGAQAIQAISVCDVDLVHQSHISDEEELRFQLPVAVFGLERDQHNGGTAYHWAVQPVQLRRGVRFRLVNVGATRAIQETPHRYGYPVCTVCGQSVSPLSSSTQRDNFGRAHEERCGRKVMPIGFYADVIADALTLPGCPDQKTAYSVLESLRMAAAQVLDMTLEDLQIQVIGHVDRDEVDAVLWDPMPGGSGLLDQICERFAEIVVAARAIVEGCPSACEASCIDCLQTFRNSFSHKYLDRKLAAERLAAWGNQLAFAHEIPAKQPSQTPSEGSRPVNEAERRLRHYLLAAGFEEGMRGEQIRLDRAIGTTTPDVIYRGAHHQPDEGVCLYLDGLSQHLHGNPVTAERDRMIRDWLRNNGYEVIEIAASDLDDRGALTRHFRRLAGYLNNEPLRERLRTSSEWFSAPPPLATSPSSDANRPRLQLVQPRPEERYVTCLPLVPLKAAAGAFSDPQQIPDASDWDRWVQVGAGLKLRPGMFVAQVVGHSMEPNIPDGSYCVFAAPVQGTRQGRIVLAQLRDQSDAETGERYTVKRYQSEKSLREDGIWRHVKVTLKPLNPDYDPIVLTVDEEDAVAVIAELMRVL
jgi:SOS-response transcriptional repressor LexA